MSGFGLIVFDYDGTLCDTRPAIAHCLRRAFTACGRAAPGDAAVVAAVKTGLPLPATLLSLDEDLRRDRAALNELVETYRTLYRGEGAPMAKPFGGTAAALQQLHADGAKCLVVSNKGADAVRRSLDASRLSGFVDMVLADEPGLPAKPDPSLLTDRILPRYAPLTRAQTLMVGDSEIDIQFAKAAGVRVCWASYGYGDVQRCRQLAPDHEISSIEDLPALARRG